MITVADTQPPAEISFAIAHSSVDEAAGLAHIDMQFVVTGARTADDVSFEITDTLNGTANAGVDYSLSTTQFVVPAGTSGASVHRVELTIIDDFTPDAPETVVIEIANIQGNAILGATSSHTLDIAEVPDSDMPKLTFATSALTMAGEGSTIQFVEVLVGAPNCGNLLTEVSFDVTIGGTASFLVAPLPADPWLPTIPPSTPGTDGMLSPPAGTLTFPAGTSHGSRLTWRVEVYEDSVSEPDETLTFTLVNLQGAVISAHDTCVFTITNDDAQKVVYVIDRSGSTVATTGLPAADVFGVPINDATRLELYVDLVWREITDPARLGKMEFSIVSFANGPEWTWFSQLELNDQVAIDGVQTLLDGMNSSGWTPMYTAIRLACQMYGDDIDRIVLLTDGVPNYDSGAPGGAGFPPAILAVFPGWFAPLEANGCIFEAHFAGTDPDALSFMQSLVALTPNGVLIQH